VLGKEVPIGVFQKFWNRMVWDG